MWSTCGQHVVNHHYGAAPSFTPFHLLECTTTFSIQSCNTAYPNDAEFATCLTEWSHPLGFVRLLHVTTWLPNRALRSLNGTSFKYAC